MLCLPRYVQELKTSEEDISFMPPQWRLILGQFNARAHCTKKLQNGEGMRVREYDMVAMV